MQTILSLLRALYVLLFGTRKTLKPAVDPPPYVFPPPSRQELEYADLAIIDLSKASTAEGRQALANQITKAMHEHGFFYAVNHGYTREQTNRIFSIANIVFDGVSEEEKKLYMGESESIYEGYKPKQTWKIQNGIRDQIEHYNINRKVGQREHPKAVRPFLDDLKAFAEHNHYNILFPILRLLALGLELPEDTLVKQHNFDASGESSVRFMKYHPRTAEEEDMTKNVWLKGHTDIGSITILWSQPVGGLQILSPDGEWRWIRHIDNALVVNTGDAIDFLCGGYYPATRHRVIQPPADQKNCPRLGVFYFSMADDDTKLVPHEESPVLQRVGFSKFGEPSEAPTMHAWRRGRTSAYGRSVLTVGKEKGVEEETIHGVVVKHFN
ncbi:Clavaminate synthase-like protein [Moniliophthora roreri MCA 2997]|uniref:Clavaminate synthase-like protein n=1 Tax=Moniliophthora roreri (strain MCA 2997) TaxID=1381753 RepID=V2WUK0_MONRO|nr:Clavaminate synthase-like protein [Moniliophthora roreri MCA 2997]KAI3615335.1 Clavaminate synthase-like protein [Moniliophthora roreri]